MGRLKKSVKRARECKRIQTAVLANVVSVGNDLFPIDIKLPRMRLSEWDEVMPKKLEGYSLITNIASDLCMSYNTVLRFDTRGVIEKSMHILLDVENAIYYPNTMRRRRLFC